MKLTQTLRLYGNYETTEKVLFLKNANGFVQVSRHNFLKKVTFSAVSVIITDTLMLNIFTAVKRA